MLIMTTEEWSIGTFYRGPSIQYVLVFHTMCYFCDNRMSKI